MAKIATQLRTKYSSLAAVQVEDLDEIEIKSKNYRVSPSEH
jgi:hypothetical protein